MIQTAPSNSPTLENFAKKLQEILNTSPFSPEALIVHLSTIPEIEHLYNLPKGNTNDSTVAEHTTRALKQYEKYFADTNLPGEMSHGLMRLTLALHDIGKPIAKAHGKREQAATIEVITKHVKKFGIPEQDQKVMLALIDGDPIGQFLQAQLDKDQAARWIAASAAATHLLTDRFFKLLHIYFQCDASSYTTDAGLKQDTVPETFAASDIAPLANQGEPKLKFDPKTGLLAYTDYKRSSIELLTLAVLAQA